MRRRGKMGSVYERKSGCEEVLKKRRFGMKIHLQSGVFMQNEIWDKKFVVKSVGKTQKIVVKKCKYGQKFVVYFGGAGYNPVRNHKRGGSVSVQGGKRSMKRKSKPLCCYFHSTYWTYAD